MNMSIERFEELRQAPVEAERVSWGDLADIEEAFYEIDPSELAEPRENAGLSDMLGEIEARLT